MIDREEKNFLSWVFMLSRINKSNLDIRKKSFTLLDTITTCGSMPISFQRENTNFIFPMNQGEYSKTTEIENKLEAFTEFQNICVQNNITLILCFSPNYKLHNIQFEKRLRQVSLPQTIFFKYDINNIVYKDKSYYYDLSHLQKNGAKIFTNELTEFLNKWNKTRTHNKI